MGDKVTYIVLSILIIITFLLSRTAFAKNFRKLKYTYILFFAYAIYLAIDIALRKYNITLTIVSIILFITAMYLGINNVKLTHRSSK